MHRHGFQGRKLQREKDQRRALIRGQVTSLVLYERITTTEAKAREIAPFFERLVTRAKQKNLAGQRALRQFLLTENAVQKMIQELEPAFAERQGGYTRVIKSGARRGDNAPMAIVSLVLPDKPAKPSPASKSSPSEVEGPAKKPAAKPKATKAAAKTKSAPSAKEEAAK